VITQIKTQFSTEGVQAFQLSLPFDEKEVLNQNINFIKTQIGLAEVHCYDTANPGPNNKTSDLSNCVPGNPLSFFS